jgi:DNA ligase (NAD+)
MDDLKMKLTKKEAGKRIEKLSKELEYHNYLYYIKNSPEISDYEFDSMLTELKELEAEFPDLVNLTPHTACQGW